MAQHSTYGSENSFTLQYTYTWPSIRGNPMSIIEIVRKTGNKIFVSPLSTPESGEIYEVNKTVDAMRKPGYEPRSMHNNSSKDITSILRSTFDGHKLVLDAKFHDGPARMVSHSECEIDFANKTCSASGTEARSWSSIPAPPEDRDVCMDFHFVFTKVADLSLRPRLDEPLQSMSNRCSVSPCGRMKIGGRHDRSKLRYPSDPLS
jgi:hypothetical protein